LITSISEKTIDRLSGFLGSGEKNCGGGFGRMFGRDSVMRRNCVDGLEWRGAVVRD